VLRGSRELKSRRAVPVLVAVEKGGHTAGRVRMRVIPDFKAISMTVLVPQHIASGATVYTDGLARQRLTVTFLG
jgi:ISXO2 transposase-like protein